MTTPETATFVQFNGFNNLPIIVRASIVMAVRQHHDSTSRNPISVLMVQYGNGDGDWTVRESLESVMIKLSQANHIPVEVLLRKLRDPEERRRLTELGWNLEELDALLRPNAPSAPATQPRRSGQSTKRR